MSMRQGIRVAVIGGAGQMGRRIGAELVLCGAEVTMYDRDKDQLDQGFEIVKAEVDMLHRRGLISAEDVERVKVAVQLTDSIEEAVRDADLVVEAVIENLDVKRSVIKSASEACPEHAIVTTNTMTCSITKVADAAVHPENVVGFRFLYPVYMIEDVEITLALQTDVQAAERIKTLAVSLGKKCFFKNPGSETFHRIDPDMYETLQREGAHNRNKRLGRLQGRKLSKQASLTKGKAKASAPPLEGRSEAVSAEDKSPQASGEEATKPQGAANKQETEGMNEQEEDDDDGDDDENEKLCTICFDAQKTVMCYPCGHLCLCMPCAQEIRRTTNICPICRTGVENVVKVFM